METSPEFEEFLEFLGERIALKGWQKYRGGLDVKSEWKMETFATNLERIFIRHLLSYILSKNFFAMEKYRYLHQFNRILDLHLAEFFDFWLFDSWHYWHSFCLHNLRWTGNYVPRVDFDPSHKGRRTTSNKNNMKYFINPNFILQALWNFECIFGI